MSEKKPGFAILKARVRRERDGRGQSLRTISFFIRNNDVLYLNMHVTVAITKRLANPSVV